MSTVSVSKMVATMFALLLVVKSAECVPTPLSTVAAAGDDADGSLVTELGSSTIQSAFDGVNLTSQEQKQSDELLLARHKRSVAPPDNTDILQVKSLCSWSYVTDHDDNRVPADIQKAANCFNRVADQTLNDCYMIYFWTPVRTRQVTSGVVTWVDSWIRLPVGCTLANLIKRSC